MIFFLILSLIVNVIIIYALTVFIKRLIQYDRLFTIITEDIETNIEYLNDMFTNHVSTNAPEILDLDRNLKLMRDRFLSVVNAINDVHEKDKKKESTENN